MGVELTAGYFPPPVTIVIFDRLLREIEGSRVLA